jgi:hypothetical protein
MAKETLVRLIDDIDGSEAAESVAFSLRGTDYEIDLNDKHVAAIDKALAKFVASARTVSGAPAKAARVSARPRKRASAKAPVTVDNGSLREWAHANGYEVGARGRIPLVVREAYAAASEGS